MSGAHDSHGHTSENELPEPKTPLWLTALGGALLLAGICYWVLVPGQGADGAQGGAAPAKSAAPAATATAVNRGKPAGHP